MQSSTATSPARKLVAIESVPIDEVVARVRPLITRDNEWSFRERVPYYLVCAEVLRGRNHSANAYVHAAVGGGSRDVALAPIAASSYTARFPYYWQPRQHRPACATRCGFGTAAPSRR